jgi:CO dehydrogenase/acetyl-CoA synthase gamma subunit (corrinoid Fe-S protein)
MKKFKAGFAKKDKINVKAVINPIGGLSYNPSNKEHKSLLLKVATKEEEAVAENLKLLKRNRPLLYKATQGGDSDEEEQ